jgi:hypothetical protein
LTETVGWQVFYLFSVVVALPGVLMVRAMRGQLLALAQAGSAKNENA